MKFKEGDIIKVVKFIPLAKGKEEVKEYKKLVGNLGKIIDTNIYWETFQGKIPLLKVEFSNIIDRDSGRFQAEEIRFATKKEREKYEQEIVEKEI